MINAIEKKKSRLKNKAEGHFEKGCSEGSEDEPAGYLRRRGKEIKSGACSVSLNNSKGVRAAAQGHKDNSTL